MERQRHNTEDLVLMNAAILPDLTETGVKGTTSADHHLLDSAFRLPFPGRALPSENLKGVRVARGVDIHVRLVHEFDQWTDVGTGEAIRTPPRSMPEYQGASVAVSGKVGLQPLVLRRSDRTASPVADPGALRVYRDDMPGPDVKAVIAVAVGLTSATAALRPGPEVVEVAGRTASSILVVAHHRIGDPLEHTPRLGIRRAEVTAATPVVLLVSQGQNGDRMQASHKPRGGFHVTITGRTMEMVKMRVIRRARNVAG
jgi:hypothetical protein